MKSGNLPVEKAFEPNEGAHQPLLNGGVLLPVEQGSSKKITFAENVSTSETPSSQINSSYKEILSQPATELSHGQKMLWLQKRRTAGLWAQCDDCDRWRYLPNIIDRHDLPKKWYCSMNLDPEYANCSAPEAPLRLRDEEDLIHSEYTAGSLVWARLAGWPWWPAMVDDCPDAEQFYWLDGFSDIPTHYNVVFFDDLEVTRAWIALENLKSYASNKNTFKHVLKAKMYNARLKVAMSQADMAERMTIPTRLEKYSFLSKHKGKILAPKKINKHDLQKYQRRFKKKFNVEFPIESSDSEEDQNLNNNVILLGTPKRVKKAIKSVSSLQDQAKAKIDKINNNKDRTRKETATESFKLTDNNNNNTEKQTNSMAAQVGSTDATLFDNDTSTTYLPGKGSENTADISGMNEDPNSDDFDF